MTRVSFCLIGGLCAFLLYASYRDVVSHRVPDWIHLCILALAAAKATIFILAGRSAAGVLLNAGMGLTVGFLVMYLAALPKGSVLGGADIKLMAVTGAFLGPVPILAATLIGSTAAFAVTRLCITLKYRPTDVRITFVPYLSLGLITSILYYLHSAKLALLI